ncbi:MAG: allantoinase [Ktedonobacteraceae bacterium]|nr:allantoinase [Ktedonobacteraceae bacterium]
MSLYDLIVRNGTLVTPSGLCQVDLGVSDERVVTLEPEVSGTSREEIDARGLHVLPGVIDAHVHFNEPGRTDWEGFSTGSRALAAGGTTAFFDMPLNAHPPTLDAESFKLKHEAAQASSYVDFALWGGLVPENLDRLEELAQCSVIGFKAFMSNSGIDDFLSVDDYTLYEGMRCIASFGGLVAVHAENDQITQALARQALAQDKKGIRDYLRSRPVVAELEAIERAILFAQETSCSLHIVHVSTGRGVRLVAEAQARGVDVSCETCPHYLVLTEEDVEALGAVAKCAPPLRLKAEQDELWEHMFAGILPMVASDHSPAPASMKTSTNFFSVWGGISGCQSLLSLLLTEGYAQRELPLSVIASITSEYVARRFKLFPRKGELAVGADADITLVDLQKSVRLDAADLLYRHKHSPYIGRTMSATIVRTLVRGRTVYQDGSIVGEPVGRLLTPHS